MINFNQSNPDHQRAADRFVAKHVHACASHLITEMSTLSVHSDELRDELDAVLSHVTPSDLAEAAEHACRAEGWTLGEDGPSSWLELAEDEGLDFEADYTEALEHWIVSADLARHLTERGEMVGEVCGLTIWGRTTSGQAISSDSVIEDILDHLSTLSPVWLAA